MSIEGKDENRITNYQSTKLFEISKFVCNSVNVCILKMSKKLLDSFESFEVDRNN